MAVAAFKSFTAMATWFKRPIILDPWCVSSSGRDRSSATIDHVHENLANGLLAPSIIHGRPDGAANCLGDSVGRLARFWRDAAQRAFDGGKDAVEHRRSVGGFAGHPFDSDQGVANQIA